MEPTDIQPYLLAAIVEPTMPMPPAIKTLRDMSVIIGAGILVTLVLLVWAFYIRKRHRPGERATIRRHHRRSESSEGEERLTAKERRRIRKKRRTQIREHRPRNPTLQETGGLPTARPEDEAPKW